MSFPDYSAESALFCQSLSECNIASCRMHRIQTAAQSVAVVLIPMIATHAARTRGFTIVRGRGSH